MTTHVNCVDCLCNACSCDLLGYVVNMLRINLLYRALSSSVVVVLVMFVVTGSFVC